MLKFGLWAAAAAVLVVLGLFGLQRLRQPETEAPVRPNAAVFPAQAPAVSGVDYWTCPADPARWPKGDEGHQFLETDEAWREFLALSGFEPPQRVDLGRSRVVLVKYRGKGGGSLQSVQGAPVDDRFEVVVTARQLHPPDEPAPKDIRYDCRLVVVPRAAGSPEVRWVVEGPPPRAPSSSAPRKRSR